MKNIWLHSVRLYIRIVLFFYYRRIHVNGLSNLPKDKPILLLSNHNNALIDALLIATKLNRFSYFLTRAAVFKKPIVSKLLHTLNMLPVYRVRDGWSTISNNKSIFTGCTQLLHENKMVTLFPEGSHNLKRTVRPLSKGFTRIVFETLETYPETDLEIIALGLNFEKGDAFYDNVSMCFGKPFKAKKYLNFLENERVIKLKQRVHGEISSLTTHINSENYNQTLEKLEALDVDFLNPDSVNNCIASNFKDCKKHSKSKTNILQSFFKFLFVISFCVPVFIWKYLIKPKIDEIEFVATFRFALAMTLAPFWLLLITAIVISFFGLAIGLYYFVTVLIIAALAVKL